MRFYLVFLCHPNDLNSARNVQRSKFSHSQVATALKWSFGTYQVPVRELLSSHILRYSVFLTTHQISRNVPVR